MPKPNRQKHHYIPKFYLKQWAGVDGRICEFSRPHREVLPRMTFPDGTGYIRGLYTFPELKPGAADFLEQQFLMRSDYRAHEVLERLLADQLKFDVDLRSRWSRFLMTMIHRSPEGLARLKTTITDGMPAALVEFRSRYEAMRKASADPTFEEFSASLIEEDVVATQLLVIQKLMNSEMTGAALNAMNWSVIRVPLGRARYPLLTSDRPLIMPDGLGKPYGNLLMPIAPDRVFFAYQHQTSLDQVRSMSDRPTEFAQSINDRVVRQARQYVWGTNDAQLRFVKNRLGERLRWSPME
jgi:hypothetical protein